MVTRAGVLAPFGGFICWNWKCYGFIWLWKCDSRRNHVYHPKVGEGHPYLSLPTSSNLVETKPKQWRWSQKTGANQELPSSKSKKRYQGSNPKILYFNSFFQNNWLMTMCGMHIAHITCYKDGIKQTKTTWLISIRVEYKQVAWPYVQLVYSVA